MTTEEAKFLTNFYLPSIREELKTTVKVMAAVPEENREFRLDPKARTAVELTWHIAYSDVAFLSGILEGRFAFTGEKRPDEVRTVADVVRWYEESFPPLIDRLEAISPEDAARDIAFGDLMTLPAAAYLPWLTAHAIHHRGQLAAYLRPMGGKVPTIYGDSADESFQAAAKA